MGQIDQLLRRIAGAPVCTVRRWRSRAISWRVITSNLLPEPSLSIIHHQLLPSRAGNAIEQMHFSYCTTRKGCNSCVLGGRAFPLCAESPHPAPCQSRSASLTNTLQNFEQILLLNIRQNLSCTQHMTCSLSCFICRLDSACKITHP